MTNTDTNLIGNIGITRIGNAIIYVKGPKEDLASLKNQLQRECQVSGIAYFAGDPGHFCKSAGQSVPTDYIADLILVFPAISLRFRGNYQKCEASKFLMWVNPLIDISCRNNTFAIGMQYQDENIWGFPAPLVNPGKSNEF